MQPSAHRPQRTRWLLLLVGYLTLLLVLTLESPRFADQPRLRLVPFETIIAVAQRGGRPFVINVLGNIGALIPLGMLVPAWAVRLRSFSAMLLVGLLTSTTIELLQWVFTLRVTDIDDVLLNVAGALAGYALYRGAALWAIRRR